MLDWPFDLSVTSVKTHVHWFFFEERISKGNLIVVLSIAFTDGKEEGEKRWRKGAANGVFPNAIA